ncbi:hypothetical protein ACFYQA_25895 [Streptomyces sp. NPDC005774]|uniref:hypothetical protein n=1 Tax=Streptomyces sp. NPDC005774 TaxID=3364728 RepID=UPI00369A053F
MADRPVRVYLVINPGPLFGARRLTFPSSAPAGSLVRVDVGGRPVRRLLLDADADLQVADSSACCSPTPR